MEFKGLKRQYLALRPQILQALEQVLEQGQYIGGPAVEGIEKQLARQAGVAHCVSCANGTDALVLLLKAQGMWYLYLRLPFLPQRRLFPWWGQPLALWMWIFPGEI